MRTIPFDKKVYGSLLLVELRGSDSAADNLVLQLSHERHDVKSGLHEANIGAVSVCHNNHIDFCERTDPVKRLIYRTSFGYQDGVPD